MTKVCICVPHGGLVHPELYRGLFQVQNALGSKGYTFAYTEVDMASVSKARNMCVEACLREGYDLIHFVDDDVIVPDNIASLYQHDADIVSGLYFARQWPHTPQMYVHATEEGVRDKYWPIMDYGNGLLECDAVGAGCLLVRTSVFDHLRREWERRLEKAADFVAGYSTDRRSDSGLDTNGSLLAGGYLARLAMGLSPWFEFTDDKGEDFYFCERAREAGFRILVDTSVKCDHLMWLRLGEAHFKELKERGQVKMNREGGDEGLVGRTPVRKAI